MRYRSTGTTVGPIERLEPRLLLAADPVTPDNPLWIIPRGDAVIDGLLDDPAWDAAGAIFRTQATRDDRAVAIRMMHNDAGLFLAADVQDFNIWADGVGAGAGNRWEVEQDDSVTFYFDPDNSRDLLLQPSDRALGVNLGLPTDPVNRADGGPVRRWKWVRGDGAGGAPDAIPGGDLPPGAAYASHVRGTVNNPADIDQGWSVEIFIPWSALGMAGPPPHGHTFGINFEMIQDNDGGYRNLADNRDNPDPAVRYLLPHFIDDSVIGSHSSFHSTQAGVRGPVNFAEGMIIDARAGERPAPITDAAVSGVGAFGARLTFTAPAGTSTGLGHVSAYQVRVSSVPITSDALWLAATSIDNAFVPRLRGLPEFLRIAPLDPATSYFLAVRAVDGAGNLGPLSNPVAFTTAPAAGPADMGRIIPSPMGSMLMFENGTPFVVVGDHLGLTWGFTRQLFPGDIWDNANGIYQNFSQHTPAEGPYGPYFDSLQARGINTMRVYLELQNVYFQGNPDPPRGLNWIEHNAGQYNPDMRAFVDNVLREAALRNMKIIFSPFDTFSYDEAFGQEGPWAANFGGPLADINNFFQSPATLSIAKNRMQAVIAWVHASPYASALLGWEPLSEWDSFEWTLNPEGDADPGRETEMRRRAVWIDDLALFIRLNDPDRLVFNSTIVRDPRGPLAREIFYSRTFDALTPHLYTNGNDGPLLNPQPDKSPLAAREAGIFTSYWISHRIDHRPVLNGEWGMTRAHWPGNLPRYGPGFTQQQDEALFRAVVWSSFASGQFGTALRITTEELASNYYLLTTAMRQSQQVFSRFVTSTSLPIDFARFTLRSLAGQVAAAAPGHSLLAWAVSDGGQGVAYVLRDGNVSSAPVSGATLTIAGLSLDRIVDVEIWSTLPGSTAPLATVAGLYTGAGTIQVPLPVFAQDLAIKFRARQTQAQSQRLVALGVGGASITFGLDLDDHPYAHVTDAASGAAAHLDLASLTNFRARAVDMTPLVTPDGLVRLALTDSRGHLWWFSGNLATGHWTADDLTAATGAPGLTGDLTSYQPGWGTIHLAGLDARGHAVNYWWAPAEPWWHFTDLTAAFGGPVLRGGLTGFVTAWDAISLAGLNDQGHVVVYWWAPGIEALNGGDPNRWLVQNMTTDLGGPVFTDQLDAFVTSWGALNIAGLTPAGEVWTYWWSPQLKADNLAAGRPDRWEVANLSALTAAPPLVRGVDAVMSTDGGINIFAVDADAHARLFRWTPGGAWSAVDVAAAAGGPVLSRPPLAASAAGQRLYLAARNDGPDANLVVFSFFLPSRTWTLDYTPFVVQA
jgi:hypothetical protein